MTFYCFGIIIVISIPIKERSFLSTTFLFFQYKQHNSKCFLAVKRWVHHSKVIMKFKNIITNISFCIFVGFECLVKSICRPDLTILKHLRAFVGFFLPLKADCFVNNYKFILWTSCNKLPWPLLQSTCNSTFDRVSFQTSVDRWFYFKLFPKYDVLFIKETYIVLPLVWLKIGIIVELDSYLDQPINTNWFLKHVNISSS